MLRGSLYLQILLPKANNAYDMAYRHEILGESVLNEEKLFSILVTPLDMTTDVGFASLENQRLARDRRIINIAFIKIVRSLKNLTCSANMRPGSKKWRSSIETVTSNLKRGFELFRCEWEDAHTLWRE